MRTLTARLVVTAVALVAVVTVLVGVVATLATRSHLEDQLDGEVAATLDRAAHGPRGGDPFGPGPGGRPDDVRGQGVGTLTAFFRADDAAGLGDVIVDGDGEASHQDLTAEQLTALADVPADGEAHEVDVSGLGEFRVQASDEGGPALVVAGLPTEDTDVVVSRLVAWETALVLLGVLLAAGAGSLLVRRQLRPLRQVAETAHEVAALPLASSVDVSARVPDELTDERTEVGRVGSALNTLLAHVETSLEARERSEQQVRQFVADASHELRTPLATITGYAELARRRPEDAETLRTAMAKVDAESARMASLVEDLLLLARLDAGRPLASAPVDLTHLLLEAVTDARVVAPDHRWRLDLPAEEVTVTGDEQRLHQVVTNLLTNARKHTPPGTTVTVGTRPGSPVVLTVHDDGPGFPPGLAAFERFTRGDASRHRTDGSAGLGLSLVRAIVGAHGGTVSLDSSPGSTTITVALPAG